MAVESHSWCEYWALRTRCEALGEVCVTVLGKWGEWEAKARNSGNVR